MDILRVHTDRVDIDHRLGIIWAGARGRQNGIVDAPGEQAVFICVQIDERDVVAVGCGDGVDQLFVCFFVIDIGGVHEGFDVPAFEVPVGLDCGIDPQDPAVVSPAADEILLFLRVAGGGKGFNSLVIRHPTHGDPHRPLCNITLHFALREIAAHLYQQFLALRRFGIAQFLIELLLCQPLLGDVFGDADGTDDLAAAVSNVHIGDLVAPDIPVCGLIPNIPGNGGAPSSTFRISCRSGSILSS